MAGMGRSNRAGRTTDRGRAAAADEQAATGPGGRTHAQGPLTRAVDSGLAELRPDRDRPAAWSLLVDGAPQSLVDLADPTHLGFEYQRRLGHLVDLVAPPGRPLTVLHLGGGALTLARSSPPPARARASRSPRSTPRSPTWSAPNSRWSAAGRSRCAAPTPARCWSAPPRAAWTW